MSAGGSFRTPENLICLACQVFSSWPCHGWELVSWPFWNPWKPDLPCLSGFLPYDLVMGGILCAGSRQACSRSWWWTRKPDVLQSMGSQRLWLTWQTKDHYILLPKKWCNLAPLTRNYPGKNIGVGCHFLFRGSSQVRDRIHISCIHRWILYHCSTWELWFK